MPSNSVDSVFSKIASKTLHLKNKNLSFLYWITFGHVVMHWYQNLFPLILPYFKSEFGLSAVQLGSLNAVQMGIGSGLMLVAGYFADTARHRQIIMLVSAILLLGISYFAIGVLPSYAWTLIWSGAIGLAVALWHPTAMGGLSVKYPKNRGLALGIHGVGASIGDSLSPIALGALITIFAWRTVMQFHLIPIIIICLVMWRVLSRIEINEPHSTKQSGYKKVAFSIYWADMKSLLRNRQFLSVMASNCLISGARVAVLTFLPIYLFDTLGFSSLKMGIYLALLFVMGAVSQPIMGILSDRFGRKVVLVPSFLIMGVLYLLIVSTHNDILLGIIITLLGAFFYPILNIAQTAIMDVGSKDVQSTTMGVSGAVSLPFLVGAPILAGLIVDRYSIEMAFIFAGIIALASTVILLPIKFTPPVDFKD